MEKHPRLSLCMIVKNEEDCIGRCLKSIQDVANEIIIVDTGSTDRTIEICTSFGAKIYPYTWNGSFADARNYGLDQATGDWILWLDADEEVDHEDRYMLQDVLTIESFDMLSIHLINYFGDKVDKDKTTDLAHNRLFRNHKGFQFFGKIHEWLGATENTEFNPKRKGYLDLKLYHYGYLDDVIKNKDKYNRNLKMLEKELEENPSHANWIHYYLATEHYRVGNYELAFQHVNFAIYQFLIHEMLPPSMLYKLKYAILIGTGSWDGAWPGIKRAVELYPDYVDLKFYMGIILFQKEMIQEALEAFEQCIAMGEDNLRHLILKGVGSFYAWYHKGQCLEKLSQYQEAANCYVTALQLSPTFTTAKEALVKLRDELLESITSDTAVLFESILGKNH